MWGELPKKYKKRLNIIAFIFLPILMILALLLSTWIAKLLRFNIDEKGIAIVFCSFIPLKKEGQIFQFEKNHSTRILALKTQQSARARYI